MIDQESVDRAAQRFKAPDGALERLISRRDRKRRKQRIIAGVVGIAVFVASVWVVTSSTWFDRTQEPSGGGQTGPTETGPTQTGPTEFVGPVPETDYVLDLDTGEVTPLPEGIASKRDNGYAVSPDGSRLAYSASGDNGRSQIFVANLDGTEVEHVTNDLIDAFSPAWSPDGSMIAHIGHRIDEPDNLFVLDLATGRSTQLTFAMWDDVDASAPEFGPWAASAPSFTPDGTSIVYNVFRYEEVQGDEYSPFEKVVRIIPIAGGKSVRLTGGSGPDDINDALLSPDGSLLSYSCGFSNFCVSNTDGTGERVLVEGPGPGDGRWSPDGTRIAYFAWRQQDVSIVDVGTGETTYVAEGWHSTWLDDHTLIVEIDRCYSHASGEWGGLPSCPG